MVRPTANAAGTDADVNTHAHTVSGITVPASDIRPPFRNLKFIRAATTTLPNGAIAIFDTTSSTLPSGWSYYSAMEGNYLRGDNSTSTGGSAEHGHTLSATADASADDDARGEEDCEDNHREDDDWEENEEDDFDEDEEDEAVDEGEEKEEGSF